MTQYSILGRLRLMGELDEGAAMEALPFCAAAMEQLAPQLKTECRNDPRLDQAGAALACCMLLQRAREGADADGISSFKAGDITVTKKQGGGKDRMAWAEQARKAAMEDIRGLLKDTGFYAGHTAFAPAGPAGRPPRKKGAKK
jgi:ABC-type transporter Mla MlaB component